MSSVENSDLERIFWTGGWDSTFLLLNRVIVDKNPVQPIYLIDSRRLSTRMELRTLDRIRRELLRLNPEAASRIMPLIYQSTVDIPKDQLISDKFNVLKAKYGLGGQYDFIVRYQALSKGSRIAIAIHLDDKLEPVARSFHGLNGAQAGHGIECELFQGFDFPLLDINKLQMEATSKEMGFSDLMEMTWFCHKPTGSRLNHACGVCNPCKYTIQEGMARRVNFRGRLRYHLDRVLPRIRA